MTKSGKVLKRPPHQSHFNAKERRAKQLGNKGWKEFKLGGAIKKKYLPYD